MVLHCDVDSNPVPRISWYFQDEELMSETASNTSLYLESLTPEQEGVYTCVGDNGYGVMNTSMYLAVKCESVGTLAFHLNLFDFQSSAHSSYHPSIPLHLSVPIFSPNF